MKASILRRNEISFEEQVHIAPSATAHEQLQRVEEWTQKSTSAPPSNRKRSAKEHENNDLEAKSQLIAEAVQLLDSRDKQTRSRTPPATNGVYNYEIDSDEAEAEEGSQYYAIGKDFRNSKLSARNYVKHFENKMRRKKAHAEAISRTYPSARSRKSLLQGLSNAISGKPVLEPDSWRFKASRSVKFAIKTGSQHEIVQKLSDDGSEDGEKWEMQQENDRDWWRWKLKQRFLQNDELLHKLASQRKKLELSMVQGENHRINRDAIFNNKLGSPTKLISKPILASASFPSARNSSWHVSVEIPSHMTPSMTRGKRTAPSSLRTSQVKAKDPIPNFYTPSKQVVTVITNAATNPSTAIDDFNMDPETSAKPKLKVLKKDPYLSKLLAGNEMFRPEMMLDNNQQNRKNQMSQEYKATGGSNTRRKLSLESLTDTDDELTASKFFNPDVKVLYERLSEMEVLDSKNFADKSRDLGGVNSREPSDGFLNLSILLETGRFNRYNKLPSMKVAASNKDAASKQQTKKSEKSYKLQSTITKMKKSNNLTKMVNAPISGGGIGPTTDPNFNVAPNNQPGRIEDLPTHEWAKRLMSKVKKQDNSTKTDDDGNVLENGAYIRRSDEINDILNLQQRKYKVPIDQETNLLYHEILMSKWKKDKHNKEKDNDVGAKNKNAVKFKRVELGHEKNKTDEDLRRPRGLDIWLENIREKAKRDRVISPLPNNGGDSSKVMPPLISDFEKTVFQSIDIRK